jgi:hypothetical protein
MLVRFCARGTFCGPAFPLACRLPSTPFACVVRSPLGPVGFAWLFPAFPPSCPFSSTIVPRFLLLRLCSGASSVLRSSQTPCPVHRWLVSSDFPPRPMAPSARAVRRVSRFSRMVLPRMLGVLRPRQVPLHLALIGTADVACVAGNRRGTWEHLDFAAQYPACVCPCQRFGHVLAAVST